MSAMKGPQKGNMGYRSIRELACVMGEGEFRSGQPKLA